jgi:hypothetical protein
MASGEWRVRCAVRTVSDSFLTAKNTEIAESFDLGNIFTKKENLLPKVGNKFLERLKMLPIEFFMIGQRCH